MKKLMILMMTVLAVSCNPYDIDEVLLMREDISMTMKGEVLFSYDPLTCQMSYNDSRNEYRMFDDKLSEWVIVRCDQRPSDEGQELTAEITWTSDSSVRTMKELTFRIERTDASGTIWMWCRKKSIGIVIKNL